MASLADTLRMKSSEVRTQSNKGSYEKKKQDITKFFEYMKHDAVAKMESRAEKGYNSSNILEYTYAEYFFIDENNEVVRTPKYSKPTNEDGKAYRIFEAIRTTEFKELLNEYQTELGEGMEIAMWWPGGNINVIEAIWGPTKYHRKTNTRPMNDESASQKKAISTNNAETAKPEKSSYATITKSPKKMANNKEIA
jgi:hypothetical protein